MRQMISDAWKNFETSGKITDYLAYRRTLEEPKDGQDQGLGVSDKGTDKYGTEHQSDGDGFKCNADWRI